MDSVKLTIIQGYNSSCASYLTNVQAYITGHLPIGQSLVDYTNALDYVLDKLAAWFEYQYRGPIINEYIKTIAGYASFQQLYDALLDPLPVEEASPYAVFDPNGMFAGFLVTPFVSWIDIGTAGTLLRQWADSLVEDQITNNNELTRLRSFIRKISAKKDSALAVIATVGMTTTNTTEYNQDNVATYVYETLGWTDFIKNTGWHDLGVYAYPPDETFYLDSFDPLPDLVMSGGGGGTTVYATKLLLTTGIRFWYDENTDILYWSSGTLRWLKEDNTVGTVSIDAGSYTYVGSAAFVTWVENATSLAVTVDPSIALSNSRYVLAGYKGGSDLSVLYGDRDWSGSELRQGTLELDRLKSTSTLSSLINVGATAKIKIYGSNSRLDVLNSAGDLKIRMGLRSDNSTYGFEFYDTKTSKSISTITRNTNVVTVKTALRNSLSPGMTITVSGVTDTSFNGVFTVIDIPTPYSATWAQTGSNTSSSGGSLIASNTTFITSDGLAQKYIDTEHLRSEIIEAKHLTMSARNVNTLGFSFTVDPVANKIYWQTGKVYWVGPDGQAYNRTIFSSDATWTSLPIFIYWSDPNTYFSTTTDPAIAMASDNVHIGTYNGGIDWSPARVNTVIHGDMVSTGTLEANRIKTDSTFTQTLYLGSDRFTMSGPNVNMLIRDAQVSPVNRVKIGKLGATSTDYGIEIRDASGNLILSSGSGVPSTAVSGLGALATQSTVNLATQTTGLLANSNVDGLGIFATAGQITSGNISTYIASAAIGNAYIANLAASKLQAGTIGAQSIYLGDTTFHLDGSNKALLINDTQGSPVTRVKIGKLGATSTDYGIEIRDASGNIILSSGSGVPSTAVSGLGAFATLSQITSGNVATYIASAAISSAYINDLAANKLTAGTISSSGIYLGTANKFTLDGVNSLITITDNQGPPVTRVKIGKLGAAASQWGMQVFDSSASLLFDTTGTGLFGSGGIFPQLGAFAGISQITSGNIATYMAASVIVGGYIAANTIEAIKIKANESFTQVLYVGGANRITLDGPNNVISVSDGTYTRVKLGYDSVSSSYGLKIYNSSGAETLNTTGLTQSAMIMDKEAWLVRNTLGAAFRVGYETTTDVSSDPTLVAPSTNEAFALSTTAFTGGRSGEYRTKVTSRNAYGNTGGQGIKIPKEFASQFLGRRIRIKGFARKPSTNPTSTFYLSYSPNNSTYSSGWQDFTATTGWSRFQFFYDVPDSTVVTDHYLGIWSDNTGNVNSLGILIDQVDIRIEHRNPTIMPISGFVGMGTTPIDSTTTDSGQLPAGAPADFVGKLDVRTTSYAPYSSMWIDCLPNESFGYTITAALAVTNPNATIVVQAQYLLNNGSITTTTLRTIDITDIDSTWTTLTGEGKSPANCLNYRLRILVNLNASPTGAWYFCNFQTRQVGVIADGSIGAEKMTRDDYLNFVSNPTFNYGDTGWTKDTNVVIDNDAANAYYSNWVAKFNDTSNVLRAVVDFNYTHVEPGEIIRSILTYRTDTGIAITNAYLTVYSYTNAKSLISATNYNLTNTSNVWTKLEASTTMPANAAFVKIGIRFQKTAGVAYVGKIESYKTKTFSKLIDTTGPIILNNGISSLPSIASSLYPAGLTPKAALAANSSSESTLALLTSVGNTSYAPVILLGKSRGTISSPTAVSANDILMRVEAAGYDGGTFRTAGLLQFSAKQAFGASDVGSIFKIFQADGGTTLNTSAVLSPFGNLILGYDSLVSNAGIWSRAPLSGSTIAYGVFADHIIASDITSASYGFYSNMVLDNTATFATGGIAHFAIPGTTVNTSNAKATAMYGMYYPGTNGIGITNYIIYSALADNNVAYTVSSFVRSGNIVTLTTSSANGWSNGQSITITNPDDTSFEGTFAITSKVSSTVVTYAQVAANATCTTGTGTAIVNTVGGGRWNLYMTGSAPNYLAGRLQLGTNVDGGLWFNNSSPLNITSGKTYIKYSAYNDSYGSRLDSNSANNLYFKTSGTSYNGFVFTNTNNTPIVQIDGQGKVYVSPTTATAPFVLAANAQNQLVTGLYAEKAASVVSKGLTGIAFDEDWDSNNKVVDPWLDDINCWTATNVSITQDAAAIASLDSTNVLTYGPGNGTTSQAGSTLTSKNLFTVKPGEPYCVSADVLIKAGFTGAITLYGFLYKKDKTTNTLVSSSFVVENSTLLKQSTDFRTVAATSDITGKMSINIIVPDEYRYGRFGLYVFWSTTQNNAAYAYAAWPRFVRATSKSNSGIQQIPGSALANQDSFNLIPDVYYTDIDFWGWQSNWAPSTNATAIAALGTTTAMKTPSGNGTTSQAQTISNSLVYIQVEPGKTYRMAGKQFVENGYTGIAYINANWYTSAKTLISAANIINGSDFRTVASTSDQTLTFDGLYTAPANATYVRLLFQEQRSTTLNNAGSAYFGQLYFSKATHTEIIANNAITNTKLRQSSALSVIGNSTNATANVADISAGANYNILRRLGTSIGFGSIDLSQAGAVGSTILAGANGGTGVANTGKTITLGGNLTTSGAFAITFVATAITNITLPTTGTLSTLAGIESLTNKTLDNTNVITLKAGNFTLQDDTTVTKQAKFLLSSITAATTRTFTLPDVSDTLVTLGAVQTLTSKTLTSPTINGGTLADITSFGLSSSGSGNFDLLLANTENLTANRTLTLTLNDAARTISLAGNITLANSLTTSGNFALTLTSTATTNITLPTSGTLSTLAGSESLTNKTLDNTNAVTLKAGSFTLQDDTTTTKQAKFLLSSITAATTRTFTLPDVNDTIVTLGATQTLTGKTLTTPTIAGGTHTAITSLGIRSSGTGAFDLTIVNTENLTADRALTITLNNTARTISLGGNLTLANALVTSGAFSITLTSTATTNVTLPTTGTLATLAGAEALSNKTITTSAGTTSVAPIKLTSGTNLTAAAAGAIEYDGKAMYGTTDTSGGRGLIPIEQFFRLSANGTAISTIANFFGTTSNISLVASAEYEIEVTMWFLKTTAGTVTVSLINSAAPTNMNVHVEQSPATGVVAPGSTAASYIEGDLIAQTGATTTFTTASLTTGVNHFIRMRIYLTNNTGTSLKIQLTTSAGTATPLINSFWKAKRLPAANVGTFAA